jgi:hypothetical protein
VHSSASGVNSYFFFFFYYLGAGGFIDSPLFFLFLKFLYLTRCSRIELQMTAKQLASLFRFQYGSIRRFLFGNFILSSQLERRRRSISHLFLNFYIKNKKGID